MSKPLLLIDIDGVLRPTLFAPKRGYEIYYLKGRKVYLSEQVGAEVLGLANDFELVWATGWENDANELIAPLLRLPALPVIHFDSAPDKLAGISTFAGERPLVWWDDWVEDGEAEWARQRNLHIPTKLIQINHFSGLMPPDFAATRRFAQNLRAPNDKISTDRAL